MYQLISSVMYGDVRLSAVADNDDDDDDETRDCDALCAADDAHGRSFPTSIKLLRNSEL
jgi:hypothetical protein